MLLRRIRLSIQYSTLPYTNINNHGYGESVLILLQAYDMILWRGWRSESLSRREIVFEISVQASLHQNKQNKQLPRLVDERTARSTPKPKSTKKRFNNYRKAKKVRPAGCRGCLHPYPLSEAALEVVYRGTHLAPIFHPSLNQRFDQNQAFLTRPPARLLIPKLVIQDYILKSAGVVMRDSRGGRKTNIAE
jgi:hypothetical protein